MALSVELRLLDGEYAVALLPPGTALPVWVRPTALDEAFVNVSYCSDELSVTIPADRVPGDVTADRGWRALKLTGSFDFDQPGIVLSVVRPLSEAGLAVFVVSTFHRDYLLVRSDSLARAQSLLSEAGHRWT